MATKWRIAICIGVIAALLCSYAIGAGAANARHAAELARLYDEYSALIADVQRDLDRLDAGVERVRANLGIARTEAGRITDWYKRVTYLLGEYAKAAGLIDDLASGNGKVP